MKFELRTKELKAALAVCSKHVNPKSPLPILSHVLIVAEPNEVKITSHDLDTGVTVTLEADVQECGSATVPAAQLASIIGLVGADKVSVFIEHAGQIVILAQGAGKTSRFDLGSLHSDEYPSVPALDGYAFSLPAAAFGNAIEEAAISAASSSDESRAIMQGVCVSAADGVLTCVGTDGRRMSVSQRAIEFQGEVAGVSVPASALLSLAKNLGSQGDVTVHLDRSKIFFEHGNARWFSRILEGRYPDWTKVVPTQGWVWVVRVNRKVLLEAVKGALLTAKEKRSPNLLRFGFGVDSISIESHTPDLGQSKIVIAAEGDGDSLPPYGINGKYLVDALLAIETEGVIWELQSETKSSVLRPDDDISYRYVVMPVKLRDVVEDFEREASYA